MMLALLILLPAHAAAERVTVVLWHAGDGEPDAVAVDLYNALRTQIETHPEFTLNDVPRQSLQELLLVLGCVELDDDCSETIADVLDSTQLAWVEVSEEDGTLQFDLRMWSIGTARQTRSAKHALRGGARGILRDAAPVLARSLLYGDEAVVEITSEPSGAQVYISGELAGTTPLTLEDQPIGFLDIEVRHPEYTTRRDAVLVDIGQNVIDWVLPSAAVARERERSESGAGIPPALGWALAGAGVAALGGGVATGLVTRGTQSDFDDLVAQPGYDRAEAESLRDRGERQALVTNLLLVSGGVLAVTGSVLLLAGGSERSPTGDAGVANTDRRTQSRLVVVPALGPGGGGLDLRVRF